MNTDGLGGLIAFLAGWLIAQVAKVITDIVRSKGKLSAREVLECFFKSGGMPSGHTASFLGLTTFFIAKFGIFAPITVLSLCTTIIVIYDAVNVRYAVGEQGKVINILMADSAKKKLRVVEGHTVPQAIVGAMIGICAGLVTFLIFGI